MIYKYKIRSRKLRREKVHHKSIISNAIRYELPLNKTLEIPLYQSAFHLIISHIFRHCSMDAYFSLSLSLPLLVVAFAFYCFLLLLVVSEKNKINSHTIALWTCQRKIINKSNPFRESSKTPFLLSLMLFNCCARIFLCVGIKVLLLPFEFLCVLFSFLLSLSLSLC